MQPLKWPVDWANLTAKQKLLLDIPFIGVLDRVHKTIVSELKQRTTSCLDSWNQFSHKEKTVAQKISKIVMEENCWPNDFFIPNDPFDIIMWDGGDDFSTTSALDRIEREFKLRKRSDDEWKNLANQTYGCVVRILAQESL